MKVAVIGAGRWGRNLVANFAAMGALALVADPDQRLREQLAGRHPGVPMVSDHRLALAGDWPAVAIATPAPTHYAIAREALEANKDVFVEKPLTLASAEAEGLAALARERGRVLMVGHLLLYSPAVRFLQRFLAEGGVGEVLSLHQERLNLGQARAVENALWSLGVHDVAVLLHLIGEAPRGLQVSAQAALSPGVADDLHLHLDFAHGVQAHLHTSWLWPEKRRRLTVVGTRAMVVYDELERQVVLHRKCIDAALTSHDEGAEVLFGSDGEPLRLELEHFLARVADRRAPLSDGEHGAAVVRVLEEASHRLEVAHAPVHRPSHGLH